MQNIRTNTAANPESASSGQNPFSLLASGVQYFSAYLMALASDSVLPDAEEPAAVICMAPDREPWLEFSDGVDLLGRQDGIRIITDRSTGLMISCREGDYMVGDENDDSVLLIGPAVMYRSENGKLRSVTHLDYRDAKSLYRTARRTVAYGQVQLSAIRLGSAVDLF